MPFQMGFSKEELGGRVPVPAGWYTLMFKGFKPKASKIKPGATESDSWNLNAEFEIVGHPEYNGRRVFAGLNSKGAWMWPDFVHATGIPMEEVQDENAGTEKASYTLPGVFEGSDIDPEHPENWKYLGPLLNKTFEAELANIPASGSFPAKNEVRQYKCAVPGCTDKHSTNLVKG